MGQFDEIVIAPSATVMDAIQAIDRGALGIALVIDDGSLVAVVTDGDIRRGLLRGLSTQGPVNAVMRTDYTYGPELIAESAAQSLMAAKSLKHLPVIDSEGRLLRLLVRDDAHVPMRIGNWAVIMAGGEGRRMQPLTDEVPKPLLEVAGRPLLAHAISLCAGAGIGRIFVSVAYKGDMIRQRFGDGSQFGVQVEYLAEEAPLGTAGPLALLPEIPNEPIVVMNADVLTQLDLSNLLAFHAETSADVTMCVRSYETPIPFGVVEAHGSDFVAIIEKPTLTHHVNAGLYVFDPQMLLTLTSGEHLDMTDFISNLHAEGKRVVVFPLHEYWMDVGNPKSLERANEDWL